MAATPDQDIAARVATGGYFNSALRLRCCRAKTITIFGRRVIPERPTRAKLDLLRLSNKAFEDAWVPINWGASPR